MHVVESTRPIVVRARPTARDNRRDLNDSTVATIFDNYIMPHIKSKEFGMSALNYPIIADELLCSNLFSPFKNRRTIPPSSYNLSSHFRERTCAEKTKI